MGILQKVMAKKGINMKQKQKSSSPKAGTQSKTSTRSSSTLSATSTSTSSSSSSSSSEPTIPSDQPRTESKQPTVKLVPETERPTDVNNNELEIKKIKQGKHGTSYQVRKAPNQNKEAGVKKGDSKGAAAPLIEECESVRSIPTQRKTSGNSFEEGQGEVREKVGSAGSNSEVGTSTHTPSKRSSAPFSIPSSTASFSAMVHSPPTTFIELEKALLNIRHSKELRETYLHSIPRQKFPAIVMDNLSTELFADLLSYIHHGLNATKEDDPVFLSAPEGLEWLEVLAKTRRIDMIVMLLGCDDQKVLQSVVDGVCNKCSEFESLKGRAESVRREWEELME